MAFDKVKKQQVDPPVSKPDYADQSAMIADQSSQEAGWVYHDGTDYWEYLGTVNGDITDYRKFGEVTEIGLINGQAITIDETDPENIIINLGGDFTRPINIIGVGDNADFLLQTTDSLGNFNKFILQSRKVEISGGQNNKIYKIYCDDGDVILEGDDSIKIKTPGISAATVGQVLTLINADGSVEWKDIQVGNGGVQSVTGDGVENSDPENPIVDLFRTAGDTTHGVVKYNPNYVDGEFNGDQSVDFSFGTKILGYEGRFRASSFHSHRGKGILYDRWSLSYGTELNPWTRVSTISIAATDGTNRFHVIKFVQTSDGNAFFETIMSMGSISCAIGGGGNGVIFNNTSGSSFPYLMTETVDALLNNSLS